MDFRTAPEVIAALHQAVERGVFGYSDPTQSYLEAVTDWQVRRFGWHADPDWMLQTPGIVTALALIMQALTEPGDKVLIQTPVYGPFHTVPEKNGRHRVEAPLVLNNGAYSFDSDIFEASVRKHRPKLFILSNPHNPSGNVWSRAELLAINEICVRHGVLVVADEIHADLIFDRELKHTTFASLGESAAQNCIVCTAPSKTFNLAGLKLSNLFVPNPAIREELKRQIERCSIGINQLGYVACEAAYRRGEPWLEALLDYLGANHALLREAADTILAPIHYVRTGALFLAWLDCRNLSDDPASIPELFLTNARVWMEPGTKFGANGAGFMRLNLGCPRSTLQEAINRMAVMLRQGQNGSAR